MREQSDKRIIYILGSGRSGTSLLEIMLGNNSRIFNCGELNRFPARNGYPPVKSPDSTDYKFWLKIREKVVENFDLKHQAHLHKKFEYHFGLIKRFFGLFDPSEYRLYQDFIAKIFNEVYQSTGCPIITDSSKYPSRALSLSETLTFDVSYIYIKRNPVSVVRSFAKKDIEQPSKNWLMANAYYFIVNFLCSIVYRKLAKRHKTMIIKYEELIQNPLQTLMDIEKILDLSFDLLKDKIKNNEEIKVGNLFDGNRIRLKPTILLQSKGSSENKKLWDLITLLVNYPVYH